MLTPQDKKRLEELRIKGEEVSEVERKELDTLVEKEAKESKEPKEKFR